MRFASRSTETTIPCTKGTRATLPGCVSTDEQRRPRRALERGHLAQPAAVAILAGPSHDLVLVEESRRRGPSLARLDAEVSARQRRAPR